MKKLICFVLALAMLFALNACGSEGSAKSGSPVDVDLTALSSTMVYSEVYNMMYTPEDYIGKSVKMSGQFAIYQASEDLIYYACVIADATACCQQGLEFVIDGLKYPDDYPELGDEITVSGEFQTYMEGDTQYCHLVNAQFC